MPQPNMQFQTGQMAQQSMPMQPGMQLTQPPEEKKTKLWPWIILLIIVIAGAAGYYFFLR